MLISIHLWEKNDSTYCNNSNNAGLSNSFRNVQLRKVWYSYIKKTAAVFWWLSLQNVNCVLF